MKKYSEFEKLIVQNNYKTLGNKQIGEMIGRSADSVKCYMRSNGIKRTPAEVTKLRKKYNSGQFLAGVIPHNSNYNGHERITKDGYIEVRIRSGLYRLKHLYNWEKIHGKLPKSYCLRCQDGNKLNTDASNWKLISRKENMLKNTIHRYPKSLVEAIRLKSLINKQL